MATWSQSTTSSSRMFTDQPRWWWPSTISLPTSGPVSTGMGDRVSGFSFTCGTFISVCQLSLAIPSWVDAMSTTTSQRAVTPCGWGEKSGMIRVWVAGKTVWSHCYTPATSERVRAEAYNKALNKVICLLLLYSAGDNAVISGLDVAINTHDINKSLTSSDYFQLSSNTNTRGHAYKLYI